MGPRNGPERQVTAVEPKMKVCKFCDKQIGECCGPLCMTKDPFDPHTDRPWHDRKLRELVSRDDWNGVIEHAVEIGTNFFDYGRIWALAMTAEFGPCGIAPSRLTNGRPDPEKCPDVPVVFEYMQEARNALRRTVGILEA